MRLVTLVPGLVLGLAAAAAAQQHPQDAPPHWSYRPLVRPEPPPVGDARFAAPLDRFAAASMQAHDLRPSDPADAATWLRRVTLDLTGLPPVPAEVAAFVAADAADPVVARERAVDALFASDAFAERWAAWWLDLARYADSQGYEKDQLRPGMWRYRDWVIDAFRRDLPFDRFTVEQLAGDLLPDATLDQRIATAFHRQTMTNTEGGTDDEEFRTAAVIDRVDTTMSVWMGTTMGCTQCHDHKYDPFTQKEFYELFAFFDQTEDADRPDDAPTLRAPTPSQQVRAKAIELDLAELRARPPAAAVGAPSSPWQLLGPLPAASLHEAHERAFAPEADGVRLDAEQDGQRWRAMPEFGDGKVHEWTGDNSAFYLYRTFEATAPAAWTLALGSDDALKVWWNGREVLAKEVARPAAPNQELLAVDAVTGINTLLLKVCNGAGPGGFCAELITAAEGEARQRRVDLEAEFDRVTGPLVPVLSELPADRRRTTHVHLRGSFLTPGEPVTAGVPKAWPPLADDAPRDRLGFARWLVAPDNPLTARVLANRIWSELFGAGIVTTLEDFGTQGEPPTHPELLDWLACELRDGWSLRHLLRTIVLSATYGQSATTTAAQRERDPDNRWLARGPSFRLSAEALRDQALAVSGLLTREVGGPSVMPPQPDGVWMQIYSGDRWQDADGPERYRRSLYTFWRRTSPHPAMLVFDAQSRESCVLRRARTNTPLQALVLWNDPQFREPAEALAKRALTVGGDAGDDGDRVRWLWTQCLLREPSASERQRLLDLLAAERASGVTDPVDAWTSVAGVVMALDEFVTRR